MAYCGPLGKPYMHFMGGPDEWDDLSRELALWWHNRQRALCKHCGTHPDDWDESRGGSRWAYIRVQHRCRGDEVLAEQELPKGAGWHAQLLPNLALDMWAHLRDR